MWLVLHKYKLPIEWSITNQSWWILGDSFWQAGMFPREVANINILCVLPWAPPAAPPLWNNVVGSVFASRCCAGCWSWAAGAIVWELLPKIRVSLASKTSMWQGRLSAVSLPASIYWEGETNSTQLKRFQRAGGSKWPGVSFCWSCTCLE